MASLLENLEAPLPRPLLCVGTPLLGLALVISFVFLGFPYDDLAPAASRELERATGREIHIGALDPRITVGGPGFALRDIRIFGEAEEPLILESLAVRPAWSTRWLQGEPTFFVDLSSTLASAKGYLALGERPGFSGQLAVPKLSRLPLGLNETIALAGALEAHGEVAFDTEGPVGRVDFETTSGSATHPSIPMPIDFDHLRGQVEIGGESWFVLKELDLDGPIFSARADGTVERPVGNRPAMIDIRVGLNIKNAPLRMLVSGLGVPIDRNGRTTINLGGSLQNPALR